MWSFNSREALGFSAISEILIKNVTDCLGINEHTPEEKKRQHNFNIILSVLLKGTVIHNDYLS